MSKKRDGRKGLRLVKGGDSNQPSESAQADLPDKVIKLDKIRDRLQELETLCERQIDASQNFSDAITASALIAGLKAPVLRAFITARVKGKAKEAAQHAEQLQLLFDEVGS